MNSANIKINFLQCFDWLNKNTISTFSKWIESRWNIHLWHSTSFQVDFRNITSSVNSRSFIQHFWHVLNEWSWAWLTQRQFKKWYIPVTRYLWHRRLFQFWWIRIFSMIQIYQLTLIVSLLADTNTTIYKTLATIFPSSDDKNFHHFLNQ